MAAPVQVVELHGQGRSCSRIHFGKTQCAAT